MVITEFMDSQALKSEIPQPQELGKLQSQTDNAVQEKTFP